MSFNVDNITMATLIKVVLPTETLYMVDGGFAIWGADTYISEHSDFGSLAPSGTISSGQGDEAPAAAITFLANSNAALNTLANPAMQWSPISIWQASIDQSNGTVIATVGLFFGFIDVPTVRDGSDGRFVDMTLVSDTERFFLVNEGNRLSQENHQRRYPGELGLNNMTGIKYDVAWGTASRPIARASSGSTSPGNSPGGTIRLY